MANATLLPKDWKSEELLQAAAALNEAKPEIIDAALSALDTEHLLRALAARTGAPGELGAAGLLAFRKGEDYNVGAVKRDDYFPLGLASYAQMLHVKSI